MERFGKKKFLWVMTRENIFSTIHFSKKYLKSMVFPER